jgi:hypothetical protein
MSNQIKFIAYLCACLFMGSGLLTLYFVNHDYVAACQTYIDYLQNNPLLTVYTRNKVADIETQQLMNINFSFADGWGMEQQPQCSLTINGETVECMASDELWLSIYVRDIEAVLTLDPIKIGQEIIQELEANGLEYDGLNDVMLYAIREHMPKNRWEYFSDVSSYSRAINTRWYTTVSR